MQVDILPTLATLLGRPSTLKSTEARGAATWRPYARDFGQDAGTLVKIRKKIGRDFQSTGSNDIQKNATFQIFKVMLWKREMGVQAGKIRKF